MRRGERDPGAKRVGSQRPFQQNKDSNGISKRAIWQAIHASQRPFQQNKDSNNREEEEDRRDWGSQRPFQQNKDSNRQIARFL